MKDVIIMVNTTEIHIIERGNNNKVISRTKLTEKEFNLDLQQIIKRLVDSHGYLTRLLLGYSFVLSMDFKEKLTEYFICKKR